MLTRVPSTSLLTMGSMADFCRGRVTGLSMTYWKKSPSSRRRRRRRHASAAGRVALSSFVAVSVASSAGTAVVGILPSARLRRPGGSSASSSPRRGRSPAMPVAAWSFCPCRRCRSTAAARRTVPARRPAAARTAADTGPSGTRSAGRETRRHAHVLPVLVGGVLHHRPALQERLVSFSLSSTSR